METAQPHSTQPPRFGVEVILLIASIFVSFVAWIRIQQAIGTERGSAFTQISDQFAHAIEEKVEDGLHVLDQAEIVARMNASNREQSHVVTDALLTNEIKRATAIGVIDRIPQDDGAFEYGFSYAHVSESDVKVVEKQATPSSALRERIETTVSTGAPFVGLLSAREEPLAKIDSIVLIRPVIQSDEKRSVTKFVYVVLSTQSVLGYASATSHMQPGIGFTLLDARESDNVSAHSDIPSNIQYSYEHPLSALANTLTASVWATKDFRLSPSIEQLPLIILIIGVLGGFLLFAITYMISTTAVRAEKLARDMTISLREEIKIRKEAEDALKKQTDDLAAMNKLMIGRELKMIELKKYIADLEVKTKQT